MLARSPVRLADRPTRASSPRSRGCSPHRARHHLRSEPVGNRRRTRDLYSTGHRGARATGLRGRLRRRRPVNLTQVMLAEEAMARTAIVVYAGGPERLGLRVDLLIGNLDSAPAEAIARAPRVERHPVDKDASDLELAMAAAVAAEARRIVVVGGDGGRLDHLLGNAFLLGSDRWAAVEIDAVLGDARIAVVRD